MGKERISQGETRQEEVKINRISREDNMLAVRVRELKERFGFDKPEDVAAVMRISENRALHLLNIADIPNR